MKKKFFIFILSLLVVIIFLTTGCNSQKEEPEKSSSSIDKTSQKIEPEKNLSSLDKTWVETVNGDTIRLKELSGKVVFIDFWATWCQPCRYSIPFLVKLYNKYKDEGLVVIGVNVNEKYAEMKSFIESQKMTYFIGYYNNDLHSVYQISGIPTFVIFDKKGNPVKTQIGYSPNLDPELERIVQEELKK